MSREKLTVECLSLRFSDYDRPFALVGSERNLRPDDWAWQFLRLNHSYQQEYAEAASKNDPENPTQIGALLANDGRPERTIRYAEKFCRSRFGLSTWLDPHCTRLPRLTRGESWFSPLEMCWDSPEDRRVVFSPGVFSLHKAPFIGSYDRAKAKKAGVTMLVYSRQDVWFAVDCSVPPIAQMASVELVAKMHQDWLVELNAEMHPRVGSDPGIFPLTESEWFESETFDSASGAADGVDPSLLWYAVRIDALAPIKAQVKNRLEELNKKYLYLCDEGLANPPLRGRFRSELIGPKDDDGEQFSDGYFLKALVLCAQMSQGGLDEEGMVTFLREHSDSSGARRSSLSLARDEWESGFEKRVANYRESARKFVKGGYRWLVHAQKPELDVRRPNVSDPADVPAVPREGLKSKKPL